MLDIDFIKENAEELEQGAKNKNFSADVKGLLKIDEQRRHLITKVEDLRSQRNKVTKEISKAKSKEERQTKIDAGKELKHKLESLEKELAEVLEKYNAQLLTIPALPRKDVPIGKGEEDNVELEKVGDIPELVPGFIPHDELAEKQEWLDFERGVKISGNKMYMLRGDLAHLEMALMRLAIDMLSQKGYLLTLPPVMVRYPAMMGTGYFPGGEEQAYYIEKDELFLIGTSEVPLVAQYSNEILSLDELPIKAAGNSLCFRREAGTYGKDTKGLYRIHQFQKVEQVVICKNSVEESEKVHAELLANSRQLVEALELPYRVVTVCTGDLGMGQVYKNDIEVWMPSRETYGETHSCSTFYDFQARRLNVRYRDEAGKVQFCHTLNNTAIASPRILIPILETHQNSDGTLRIPKLLQPYMNNKEIIGKPIK